MIETLLLSISFGYATYVFVGMVVVHLIAYPPNTPRRLELLKYMYGNAFWCDYWRMAVWPWSLYKWWYS
jgi:hypothetical protein